MKKRQTKKFFTSILSLSAVACLMLGGTFLKPVAAKAEDVTVSLSSIVTLENANAGLATHTSKYAKGGSYYRHGTTAQSFPSVSYTGLTISSDTSYEGKFNGQFSGNTTINYKFPGTAEDVSKISLDAFKMYNDSAWTDFAFGVGDGDGDFYFTVTSKTNPDHTFKYHMGDAGTKTNRQYVELTNDNGTKVYSSANKDSIDSQYVQTSVSQEKFSHFNYFNSNERANALSFQVYKNGNGYWAVKAYLARGNAGKWYDYARDIAVFNGSGNMPAWDFTEGYTIEFGSEYATGTDVCFTAINGTKLNTENLSATLTGNTEITYPNEKLEEDKKVIDLEVNKKLEQFSLTSYATTTITSNNQFELVGKAEKFSYENFDSSKIDKKEINVSYGASTKTYQVNVIPTVEYSKNLELITVENAVSEIKTHTSTLADGKSYYSHASLKAFPAVSYTGLTVSSDTAYTGKFAGEFVGNTTINYKFPGTAADESQIPLDAYSLYTDSARTNFAFGIGDVDGDFYFKITSNTNTAHSFTYNLGNAGTLQGRQYVELVNDSGKTVYSSAKRSSPDSVYVSTSMAADNFAYFTYFNNSEIATPVFFTLYLNANNYWALKAYVATNNGGQWYNSNRIYDIAIFNGSNGMPSWDFSDGYTIEFGSEYETGTDVCFTSINGRTLNNNNEKACSYDINLEYNGKVEGDGKIYLPKGSSLENFNESYNVWYANNWAKKRICNEVGYTSVVEDLAIGTHTITLETKELPYVYVNRFEVVIEQNYKIQLNSNGGTEFDDILYSENTLQYKTLETPSRLGWQFQGWYLTENFTGEPVEELSMSLGNCTLYAKWWEGEPPVIQSNGKPYLETVAKDGNVQITKSDVYVSDTACGIIPEEQISIFIKKTTDSQYVAYTTAYSFDIGEYMVKYVATDTSGNVAEYVRIIKVVSSKAPIISLSFEIDPNGIVGKQIDLPTASAEGYEVVRTIVVNGDVMNLTANSLVPEVSGEYTIVYYAENEDGIPCQLTYTIIVVEDTEAPIIVLTKTNYQVLKGTVVTIDDLIANDNVDGEIVCNVWVTYGTQDVAVVNNQFTASNFGAYTITYRAVDKVGNFAEKAYNVLVVEKITQGSNDENSGELNNSGNEDNQDGVSDSSFGCNGFILGKSGCSATTIAGVGPIVGTVALLLLRKKNKKDEE